MTTPSVAVRVLVVAAIVIGVSFGAAAAAIPLYVQSRLAAALRTDLRARRVDVTVRASPQDAWAGRFERLDVTVEDFLAGALPVRRFDARLAGAEIDRQRLERRGELFLRRLAEGTMTVTVTEAGLQDYLLASGTLREARVRLAGGEATVQGVIRVLTVDVRAVMRGAFVIRDGRQIAFLVRTISLADVRLPPEVGQSLSAAMNPLVTADDFPLPLRFVSVRADDGELVLRADAAR